MNRALVKRLLKTEATGPEAIDLPYGRMKNLNSTGEIDDGIYKIQTKYDSNENEPIARRKCVPLVLRCGVLWIYLHNTTD